MKVVFGCLMCSVLVISQTFARDPHVAANGGPAYPGTSGNIAGTYAGVLMPQNAGNPSRCASNSLGIFSLVVPTSGLSNGTFVMFAQGRIFSGTIQAAADPEKGRIRGILDASFDFTVTRIVPVTTRTINPDGTITITTTPTTIETQVTASAKGKIDTDITSSSSISLGIGARLDGSAVLRIDQGELKDDDTPKTTCKMSLNLDGFKQSSG
jgi:hypothetical protein